jgi:hypothetical protein
MGMQGRGCLNLGVEQGGLLLDCVECRVGAGVVMVRDLVCGRTWDTLPSGAGCSASRCSSSIMTLLHALAMPGILSGE